MTIVENIKQLIAELPTLAPITLVASGRHPRDVMVGCEDGSIAFTANGGERWLALEHVSESGDAINGIASVAGNSLAVSTRSEVTFLDQSAVSGGSKAVFPGGAHGVVATRSGVYVSPLGLGGLMFVRPSVGDAQKIEISRPSDEKVYFYRLVSLNNSTEDVLLFANRTGGVGACKVVEDGSRRILHQWGHVGLDIVDVCAIPDASLSGVAVSRDGQVVLIRDASQIAEPLVFRPPSTSGVVYRILATPQHLCILTSRALYVWLGLVGAFRAGHPSSVPAVRAVFNVSAADIALIGQELLVITGGRQVESVSLEGLAANLPLTMVDHGDPNIQEASMEEASVEYVDHDWESRDLECDELIHSL
jgi:hypothetical protein